MAVDPINAAIKTANERLAKLLADRAKTDKDIVEWKRVLESLSAVSESSEDADPSDVEVSAFVENKPATLTIKFTDGVRMVLRQNASRTTPISVPEIREHLINLGFSFAKYTQPLVPIHNTLKRLEEQGEVSHYKNEQGQTMGYKWISPIERALSEDSPVGYGEATGESVVNAFGARWNKYLADSRAVAKKQADIIKKEKESGKKK
jgi:hypothetical protein